MPLPNIRTGTVSNCDGENDDPQGVGSEVEQTPTLVWQRCSNYKDNRYTLQRFTGRYEEKTTSSNFPRPIVLTVAADVAAKG